MTAEPEERVRLKPHPPADPYGIVVSKDVMVPMRDGVRLAFDIFRPARDGDFVDGAFPTIMLHTPYDKTDKRYTEIADFFVPRGYNTVLVDLRDRYKSEASGVYYHAATPHTGRDGYDICEWIAAQPWSNGRIGTVGSSYGAITQVRTALEAPPHLTAIWPDVVPTNSFQNQCREGGAMQGHMFWALFIHAQDAQDVRDDPAKTEEVWENLRDLRQLFRATPWQRGQTALRHVPTLEESLIDYYTRGAYDEYWSRIEHDYTNYWEQHADIPGTFSTRLVRPVPGSRLRVLRRHGREERCAAAARDRPLEPRGMRGDSTFCHEVDFGPDSVWGVQRYFEEQLAYFSRWLPDDATGQPEGEAPVRIFVMGGGSGRMTAGGQARPRRPLARGVGVAAGASRRDALLPPLRTAPCRRPCRRRPPSRAGSPSTRPTPCRRSAGSTARSASFPRAGPGWSRPGRASSAPCCGSATCSRPGRPTRRSRLPSSAPRSLTRGCPHGRTCSSSRPIPWRRRSR